MKKITAALLILTLLAGCAAQAEPTPIPTEEASPAPTMASDPVSTETITPESPFGALPVTEKGIWDYYLYEMKGDYIIRGITPYEGDYLVELGRGYEGETMLVWIFGDTGRKVQMTAMGSRSETEIRGRGALHIRTDGYDTDTPWKGLPKTYRAVAPTAEDYAVKVEETTWLPPSQGVQIGFWDEDGMMYSERYEQLCDVRITADGLSLSFIPNTDSMEKFQSFFPASTTIPSLETSYDEAAETFTLRLYNTSLKSGEYARDMSAWIGAETGYEGLYPRTIPEGSLGADSLFLTGVEIHQDGEDAVITARLTERAGWFTVDSGNLGYDDIPWLTLRFREPDSMEVDHG